MSATPDPKAQLIERITEILGFMPQGEKIIDLQSGENFALRIEAIASAWIEDVKKAKLDDEVYLKNVRRVIDDLAKNAAHSFGIDFMALNEAGIETNKRLGKFAALTNKSKEQ